MRRLVLAFCASAALAAPGLAQPGPQEGPSPGGPPREEVFKMVDAYIVSNLQESLGLSDDQFVKLLPLVKRLQTDRRSFAQRRMEALGELRRLLRSGAAGDARVQEALRTLKTIEVEEPATVRKDQDAVDAALTPLQQAKYRVLEIEVERRLREILAQVRQNAQRRRRDQEPPRQR